MIGKIKTWLLCAVLFLAAAALLIMAAPVAFAVVVWVIGQLAAVVVIVALFVLAMMALDKITNTGSRKTDSGEKP